ncbi:hypothetical protein AMATHDRAFT_149261 [Amanita thiersii Skay4041]|uniref:F-box domain-containing protein n=1 Tax=Amanita thiersii Skay4041 TaxID=703135 RepID=A0A2A9NH96_9AGAR|nr:hypothetical protein AMATHDRAFT_149261 [Amanita thiersii Skay4041]
MHSNCLSTVPAELLCHIFDQLDILDLLSCTSLQYTIELVRHKFSSMLPSFEGPSYARRLQLLCERECAWRQMSWRDRYQVKTSFNGSVSEFVYGVYANSIDEDNGITKSISFLQLPSTNSNPWSHTMPEQSIFDFCMDPIQDLLVLLTLAPSSSNYLYELQMRTLSTNESHPNASCSKILCIKGSYQHTPLSDVDPVVKIQVFDEFLAILFKELYNDEPDRLLIWNWKYSFQTSCMMYRELGIHDFTFIDKETFLLARPSESLEVYQFKDPKDRANVPFCIGTFGLPPLSSDFEYEYITFSTNPTPGYVPQLQKLPICNGNLSSGVHMSNTVSDQFYYPSPDDRILACCLYISDTTQPDGADLQSFTFFVNTKTFKPKDRLERMQPKHPPGSVLILFPHATHLGRSYQLPVLPLDQRSHIPETQHYFMNGVHLPPLTNSIPPKAPIFGSDNNIPWSVWGDKSTRWFDGSWRTDWQHATYGMRTAESVRVKKRHLDYSAAEDYFDEDEGFLVDEDDEAEELDNGLGLRSVLRVRDFNPCAVAMAKYQMSKHSVFETSTTMSGRTANSGEHFRFVTEPSIIPSYGVFQHDIRSSLPYTEILSRETFDVTDVLLDDRRILLLKRGKQGDLKSIDVLTM